MAPSSKVVSYRTGMANLLAKLLEAAGETERWLDVAVEGDEASARAVLEDDPSGPFRITCAVLLHKAKLHMVAMLRADANNNVHSLAVQMRPVLECAGQVVLVFHNLMVEPERGVSVFLGYVNADYYRTFIGLMEGDRRHEQLLTQISEASGMSVEEISKGGGLKQADKVALLKGSKAWYGYLSDRFCHGKADWRGHSWQGAIEVLVEARQLGGETNELIFPSFNKAKLLSDMTFTTMLRRLEIPAVPHGFRSSFRDWCSEEMGEGYEIAAEMALAHNVGNATRRAYARSNLLDQRRVLMQAWADYVVGAEPA